MIEFKKYIAEQLIGKSIHFKCDCLFPLNNLGVIKDYEILDNEIIFKVIIENRLINIGENHPNLVVEEFN